MSIENETEYASQEEEDAAKEFNAAQELKRDEISEVSIPVVDNNTDNLEIKSDEFQLTPEIQEMVMKKVRDIDAYGTAFSSLSFQQEIEDENVRFDSILKNGLLGSSGYHDAGDGSDRLINWHHSVRSEVLKSKIWFNIVGRMRNVRGPQQIKESGMIDKNGVAVVFDLDHFKELKPGALNIYFKRKKHVSDTFSANVANKGVGYYVSTIFESLQGKNLRTGKGNKFSYKSSSCHGFMIPFRIAPRLFTGLIANTTDPEFANSTVQTMLSVYKEKTDNILPVYNTSGDLLWPQRMSHQEVKDFVAQRDV